MRSCIFILLEYSVYISAAIAIVEPVVGQVDVVASGAESPHSRTRRAVTGQHFTYHKLQDEELQNSQSSGYVHEYKYYTVMSIIYTQDGKCYETVIIQGKESVSAVHDSVTLPCIVSGEERSVYSANHDVVVGTPGHHEVVYRKGAGEMVIVSEGECTKLTFVGNGEPEKREMTEGCEETKRVISSIAHVPWNSESSNGSQHQAGSHSNQMAESA